MDQWFHATNGKVTNEWMLSTDGCPRGDGVINVSELFDPYIEKSVLDRVLRWYLDLLDAKYGILMRTDERGVVHVEGEYFL